jgi:HAMP domain-containing protein
MEAAMENDPGRSRMPRRPGLRLKFNLVLVPTIAVGIAAIVWADYRHESTTLMEAHAVHESRVGTGAMAGPMDPWTLPDAATQRSLRLHAVAGGALLVVVVIVVNLTLQGLVLRPIASMRRRITELEHGHWRGQEEGTTSGRDDEVGALYEGFRRLGSEIDALVGQLLRADRLATLALVSKHIEARVEPEVRRIGEVAGRLTSGEPTDARAEGELLGRAAATIHHAVHEYDAVFERRPGGGAGASSRTRDAA